eukprot:CAMPEP_0113547166 /NCGR_PEP_ID=MMETSP0015_2-20120614/12208_1 /TAXON_ID=2838 /ORGANISM="Odontella" /LENGTH=83 /DNA_ID=CAMNT_0000447697 /DNA_START=520 /DNA_END=771 /DNA_ORIENTATION=+ /assembly_acc=CAM_ASM_000160
MSRDEAVVRAMVENARNSTWRENLENAASAQERFALPGREDLWTGEEKHPDFINKIVQRSDEMMNEDRKRRRRTGSYSRAEGE